MTSEFRRIVVPCALALAVIGMLSALAPAAAGAAGETAQAARRAQIDRLVAQLGDQECTVREAASRELIALGAESKPALTAALDDPDLEIRARARLALDAVNENIFQAQLVAFAADPSDARRIDLPGWARFRRIAGGQPEARAFFVAMVRAERQLFKDLDVQPARAGGAVVLRIQSPTSGQPGQRMTLYSAAAILFAALDERIKLPDPAIPKLFEFAAAGPWSQPTAEGKTAFCDPAWKLLGALAARDFGGDRMARVSFALRFNLPAGAAVAADCLQKQNPVGIPAAQALMAIGLLGDKKLLPVVESYMDRQHQITMSWATQSGNVWQVHTSMIWVPDAAKYACLQLNGCDVKKFGFKSVNDPDLAPDSIARIGFQNMDERQSMLQKWDVWRAAHPPAKPQPVKPSPAKPPEKHK
jgi:hypothetical protein